MEAGAYPAGKKRGHHRKIEIVLPMWEGERGRGGGGHFFNPLENSLFRQLPYLPPFPLQLESHSHKFVSDTNPIFKNDFGPSLNVFRFYGIAGSNLCLRLCGASCKTK